MDWSLYARIADELAQIGREYHFQPRMTYCYMADPFVTADPAKYTSYAQEQGIDVYLNTNAAGMTP